MTTSRAGTPPSALSGGGRRQGPAVGSLSRAGESSGASAYARWLCQQAQLGDFYEPLAELKAAPDLGPNAPSLVAQLRDTVAHELTRRIDHRYAEVTPRALNVLTVCRFSAEEMVVDRDEQLPRVWSLPGQAGGLMEALTPHQKTSDPSHEPPGMWHLELTDERGRALCGAELHGETGTGTEMVECQVCVDMRSAYLRGLLEK